MGFNHLNVPESWQAYFTKYPNGLSILEAIIQWVSQVDAMVDHLNLTDEQIEKLFTDTLPENVETILDEWYVNGKIADLINLDILGGIETQLEDHALHLSELKTNINVLDIDAHTLFGTAVNQLLSEAITAGKTSLSIYVPSGNYIQDVAIVPTIKLNIEGAGIENTKIIKNFDGVGINLLATNNSLFGFTYDNQFVTDAGSGIVIGDITHQSDQNRIDVMVQNQGLHGVWARNGNINVIHVISNFNKGDGVRLQDDLVGMGDNTNANKVFADVTGNLGNGLFIEQSSCNDIFVTAQGNYQNGLYCNSPNNRIYVYAEGNVVKDAHFGYSAFGNFIHGRPLTTDKLVVNNKRNYVFNLLSNVFNLNGYNTLESVDYYNVDLYVGVTAANSQKKIVTGAYFYYINDTTAFYCTIDKVLPVGVTVQVLREGTEDAGAITIVINNNKATETDLGTVKFKIGAITPSV